MVSAIRTKKRCAVGDHGASLVGARTHQLPAAILLNLSGRRRWRERLKPRLERMEVSGISPKLSERCSWQLIDACLNRLDAVLLERVREEPRIDGARLGLTLRQQFLEHRHHSDRTDSSADDVVESFLVGFCFILAAETRKH